MGVTHTDMWTPQKEARYQELAQKFSEVLTFVDSEVQEANMLGAERDEFILQALAKQGPLREREPNDKEFLQLAAESVTSKLPDNWGFILFVFPIGKSGRIGYVSNARREDAVKALKEWLLKQSPENWLRHIE